MEIHGDLAPALQNLLYYLIAGSIGYGRKSQALVVIFLYMVRMDIHFIKLKS